MINDPIMVLHHPHKRNITSWDVESNIIKWYE
jgi:hypothetical protein